MDTPLLTWTAPEYPSHVRSTLWYIVAGVIAVALLAYSIVITAWTFTGVLVLGLGAYVYTHRKPHPLRRISITDHGVVWGNTLVQWAKCEGFWLLQGPGYVELHIELKEGKQRHIVIQTGTEDPVKIYTTIVRFIPLFPDRRENLLDALIRICKI